MQLTPFLIILFVHILHQSSQISLSPPLLVDINKTALASTPSSHWQHMNDSRGITLLGSYFPEAQWPKQLLKKVCEPGFILVRIQTWAGAGEDGR